MTTLQTLCTPALLLDRQRMDRNIAAMKARASAAGVRLRPHVKTAKSVPVIERMSTGDGVTVSTLAEARAVHEAGIRDITYAVGIGPSKVGPALELVAAGADLKVLTDNVPMARLCGERAAAAGQQLAVMIELDCSYGRAGISGFSRDQPGSNGSRALVELGALLHGHPHLTLAGVLTHGGHSYDCRGGVGIEAVARQERDAVVQARGLLADAGLPCPVTSAGSTPTAVRGVDSEGGGWHGVDELRPGNYVFFDLAQAQIGSCTVDDIAVSVLATVIGHRGGGAVVDAGSLAMSPDSSVADTFGYGLVTDLQRRPIRSGTGAPVVVQKLSQEHGWLGCADGLVPYDLLPIGALVRILPAHSCITAAQHERCDVIGEGGGIEASWPRIRGW